MTKIEAWITEWAYDYLRTWRKEGFSGINAVERLRHDPGISKNISGHKILWWPRNKRISKVSKAMHLIDELSQACLIVRYGKPMSDDGIILTGKDFVKSHNNLTYEEYRARIREARRRLEERLWGSRSH